MQAYGAAVDRSRASRGEGGVGGVGGAAVVGADLTSASVAAFMQRVLTVDDIHVGEEAAREILAQNDWDVEKSVASCLEGSND